MGTFIIAAILFGSAGYVIYRRFKNGPECDDASCNCGCSVNKKKVRKLKKS